MYLQEKVDKYYPGARIYEAMEVWSLPKNKLHTLKEICESGKYFAQTKIDGNWYEYCKTIGGDSYLFSRGTSTKTGLPVEAIDKTPHIKEAFEVIPEGTVLIGEIFYPQQTTNEVRTIMGCLPKKAIERQKEKGKIHFYLHDIVRYKGEDLTSYSAEDRYSILSTLVEYHNLLQYDFIHLAKSVYDNIYDFILTSLDNGEEGVVLKLKTAPYSEGKRPAWDSIKVKKQDDIDVVCMGFEDATMEYTGNGIETWPYWKLKTNNSDEIITNNVCMYGDDNWIPITKPYYYNWKTSMKIGLYDNGHLKQIGTVSSGLTDELREQFSKHPDKYIGKVVVCNCMEKTENALRHPKFIRFREDKDAQKCLMKDVF